MCQSVYMCVFVFFSAIIQFNALKSLEINSIHILLTISLWHGIANLFQRKSLATRSICQSLKELFKSELRWNSVSTGYTYYAISIIFLPINNFMNDFFFCK